MKKLRSFIDQVGKPATNSRNYSSYDTGIEAPIYSYNSARSDLHNPIIDRETLENIEEIYFTPHADTSTHELLKLPENAAIQIVEAQQRKIKQQLAAVSKKLSDVILENQPSYTKELKEVQELQKSLHNAFIICSNGRRYLMSVSLRSTETSLALLRNQQRRQKLASLLDSLYTIKTLQHTDVRLRELLEEEDYAGAIQLCQECQQAASTYKHYHCIKDLSSKLQDTLEQIEEQIDVALSKTCKNFDAKLYSKLQQAYSLLGKTQSAMDQLLMHYTSSIHNTAFQVTVGFVKLVSTTDNIQKKQYKDVCNHISKDIYIPCLMGLCKALWEVMFCYHKTSQWHCHNKEQVEDEDSYVNRKLAHGRHRVWADVQSKIRTYILSSDLSVFSYDEFILILDIVKRLIQIGTDFCRTATTLSPTDEEQLQRQPSDNLAEPLRRQTLSYFHVHHRARLDELLMFLDNESWQHCPVKPSFDVFGMQEFKFLKDDQSGVFDQLEHVDDQSDPLTPGSTYFDPYHTEGQPFSDLEKTSQNPDAKRKASYDSYHDEDDEIDEELRQDFIDEKTGETPTSSPSFGSAHSLKSMGKLYQGPILTNTSLHVLRLCGSYLKMCDVLQPISMDVVVCMSQLFDMYFYAVNHFFSTNEVNARCRQQRLHATMQRIDESLFLPLNNDNHEPENGSPQQVIGKVQRPSLSPMIDLNETRSNFAITERIIATESLVFLGKQFELLESKLEGLVPLTKKAFLKQFYSQTVRVAADVRWPAYQDFVANAVNPVATIEKMAAVNWDVHEIMSQHNSYVDSLLQELSFFKATMSNSVRAIEIPEEVGKVIWKHCISICNNIYVEGFSNVRKCSNEGRALMQLDYQQFLLKLEKLSNIRPIPNREFVETYIKAYYLTESDLETWMRSHSEYTTKQLSALVHCSAATYSTNSTNRRSKQKFMSLIDELTSRK